MPGCFIGTSRYEMPACFARVGLGAEQAEHQVGLARRGSSRSCGRGSPTRRRRARRGSRARRGRCPRRARCSPGTSAISSRERRRDEALPSAPRCPTRAASARAWPGPSRAGCPARRSRRTPRARIASRIASAGCSEPPYFARDVAVRRSRARARARGTSACCALARQRAPRRRAAASVAQERAQLGAEGLVLARCSGGPWRSPALRGRRCARGAARACRGSAGRRSRA